MEGSGESCALPMPTKVVFRDFRTFSVQKQKEYGIILANMISVPVRVRPEGGQIAKRTLCIPGRGHARRICFHRIGVRGWGNEIREKR